jgi:type IV pilus assembly protein PilQ
VVITGNQMLTYTSVRQPFPAGVVLYFPDTEAGQIAPQIKTDTDVVGPITISELTESGHTTRVEIGLSQDASYDVAREGEDLQVSVSKPVAATLSPEKTVANETVAAEESPEPAAPEAEATAAPVEVVPASQLVSVETDVADNGLLVKINADGIIRDFNAFTLSDPARIVLDIFNVQSPYTGQQKIAVDSAWISRIRHYGTEEKLRIVLDTKEDYLSAYNAVPVAGGLAVSFGDADVASLESAPVHRTIGATGEAAAASGGTPALVNRIDFSSDDGGKSSLIIGLTAPAEYQVDQIGDGKLLLTLINTQLPDYRQKPLVTTRFESAVDRIVPYQLDDQPNNALFTIELREMVPYQVEQMGDALQIMFDASTIPPRMLSEANLAPWQQALNEAMAIVPPEGSLEGDEVDLDAPVRVEPQSYIEELSKPKEFTGEKIALDFYDTDIKNVFRILEKSAAKTSPLTKTSPGALP